MTLDLTVSKFIEKERLLHDKALLLCAVSGGIDSMVMLEQLRNKGYTIHVAHVNYMLRGNQSNLDQKLVEHYCDKYDLTFHVQQITPQEVKSLKQGNLQEKARIIRYSWFKSLCEQHKLDYICMAHHQGDLVESFFLNAIRGAGAKGLSSIKAKNGRIRRPLLSISKKEIERYAHLNDIPYRQDASNESDEYDRNFIRNQVLPLLQERWPNGLERIAKSIGLVSNDAILLQDFCRQQKSIWLKPKGKYLEFGPLSEFRKIEHADTLAFHILKDFGFDFNTVAKMILDEHISGAYFSNEHFECITNRNHILFRSKKEATFLNVHLDGPGKYSIHKAQMNISMTDQADRKDNKQIEYAQLSSIKWPLTVRFWKNGDSFKPLGMNGKLKKLSDFLIDLKVSRFEKEDQLVVEDNEGEIIWVIGKRLSESVKITDEKKGILRLEWC